MKSISSRMQFGLVGMGYAAVLLVAAAALYAHHLLELDDRAAASGGMAAFGEMLLCLFIGCILGDKYVAPGLSWFCFYRILESPVILAGMGTSRFAARFAQAKRFVSYAILVEGLTLALPVAAFTIAIIIK